MHEHASRSPHIKPTMFRCRVSSLTPCRSLESFPFPLLLAMQYRIIVNQQLSCEAYGDSTPSTTRHPYIWISCSGGGGVSPPPQVNAEFLERSGTPNIRSPWRVMWNTYYIIAFPRNTIAFPPSRNISFSWNTYCVPSQYFCVLSKYQWNSHFILFP